MDSTMVYQLIGQQVHREGELLNLLPTLAHLASPHARLTTHRMNHQQILAQVHSCVKTLLTQTQQQKQSLLLHAHPPNSQHQEEEEQELQEEDENEGMAEQGQEQIGQEDEEMEQEEGEMGEQEERDILDDEQPLGDEEDIGLYGQEIDEEEMESYENEGDSQDDKEFEEERQAAKRGRQEGEGEDEGEELINDQFDHFREVQLQNKEEETGREGKNELERQIERLESRVVSRKEWMLQGEVRGSQRPVNSLLEQDLQFKTGIRLGQEVTAEQNEEMEKMIKQRVLDELFDDRVRYQPTQALREQFGSLREVSTEKSKAGLGELYESDFKNYLGLGEDKQDRLRADIMQGFKEVSYFLDALSNSRLAPRPQHALRPEAAIVQERVPTSRWKAQEERAQVGRKFESEKEERGKEKRAKNKRIARQRRKEADRKRVNKKIEYGGMTKFEAKAKARGKKNSLASSTVKYNKSANFFGEMNRDKSRKPNPNLSKLTLS